MLPATCICWKPRVVSTRHTQVGWGGMDEQERRGRWHQTPPATQLSFPFQTSDFANFPCTICPFLRHSPHRVMHSCSSSPTSSDLQAPCIFLSLNRGVQLPPRFPLTSKALLSTKHFFPSSVSQHCGFSAVRHLNPTKDMPGACSLSQILFLRHLKQHTSHLVTRSELSATESLLFPKFRI